MPTQIKTDPALLKRLAAGAKRKVSKEQQHRQRVSFIHGGLPANSTITRAQIESVLAKMEGEAA